MSSMKEKYENYYLGLDIGTNSVGYAVTDPQFNILKHKGDLMWGSHVFEEGKQCEERRGFRTSRRRLNRRQQRVHLTQQIFAKEISKVDERFFIRLQESALFREDTSGKDSFIFFKDDKYTDKDYHQQYPTIHHLIQELMEFDEPHDIRLVYLAVSWLVAHRGHFLNEVNKDNIEELLEFEPVYNRFMELFVVKPWVCEELDKLKAVLLEKKTVGNKEKSFYELLFEGKKPKATEEDIMSRAGIIKLLSGGTIEAKKLFPNSDFEEKISISFRKSEEDFEAILNELKEEAEYLIRLRAIYDWSLLIEALHGCKSISEAKVEDYKQHQKDLETLKTFVRKYCTKQQYDSIFREIEADNYVAYVYNLPNEKRTKDYKKTTKEGFCDYLKKKLKDIVCEPEDLEIYEDMMLRLETYSFMPKQVNGDNRVIPYQLYYYELKKILFHAEKYLPFLQEKDETDISNAEKLMSIFEFRIPYFVGPLSAASTHAWMYRKAEGKIYPWNFKEKVDLDRSEDAFIDRMTNNCTYLQGETVVPKNSLLYSKFKVLNEINNIKINGNPISPLCKQGIYQLFLDKRKVTVKQIKDYLLSNNYMAKEDVLGGIDISINSSLGSYHDFKRLLTSGILNEKEVERIIECLTYSEERGRILHRLNREFPELSEEDKRYLSKLKYKDFGRLSRRFLTGLRAANKETGESVSIMDTLWETNDNLEQIIFGDSYTFKEVLEEEQNQYYSENPLTVESLMEEMYISNAVKRPIYRTLDVVKDIKSVCARAPQKIFVEMARWKEEKNTRKASRRNQILELYKGMNKNEVRELSEQLENKTDSELRSEVLFLYFMQLGRSMYSNKPIDINKLKTDAYNVDHIYPQCRVKDDSLSNKVLVLSEENGAKGDRYPIDDNIRREMSGLWKIYHERGLISDEKYRRLTRTVPFSNDEKMNFINRQLVETQQSTKAIAKILQNMFPDTEIVYVKAGLTSQFRNEVLDIKKSRIINDLHHAKDAYLNIVAGEVYHTKFSKKYFKIDQDEYSVKAKIIFGNKVWRGKEIVWDGGKDIARVRKMVSKNFAHYTRYAFERRGGLFDQMPVRAAEGLVPRKAGLDTKKYGGYNKSTASYFLLVKYTETAKKEKTDIMIVPIELMYADKVKKDEAYATEYVRTAIAEITGKAEDVIRDISLPLGLRQIKVNTIFSLDGFLACLAGKSSGGQKILLSSMMSMVMDAEKESYVKLLENFVKKRNENSSVTVNEKYDGITKVQNNRVYEFFESKLKASLYKIAFGGQGEVLEVGKDKFEKLSLEEQAEALLNILSIFTTGRTPGCNLKLIGGAGKAAVFTNSSKLSNWKKSYQDVRIIDVSAAGLHKKQSENILELL